MTLVLDEHAWQYGEINCILEVYCSSINMFSLHHFQVLSAVSKKCSPLLKKGQASSDFAER